MEHSRMPKENKKKRNKKGSPRDAGKPGFFLALESNFFVTVNWHDGGVVVAKGPR